MNLIIDVINLFYINLLFINYYAIQADKPINGRGSEWFGKKLPFCDPGSS